MYIFVLYEMSRHTNNSFLPWSSCMLSWYGKINGIVKSVFVQLSWQIWSDLFLLPVLHWSIYYVPINRIYVNIVKRCLFCYHGYHMCKFRFFLLFNFFPSYLLLLTLIFPVTYYIWVIKYLVCLCGEHRVQVVEMFEFYHFNSTMVF